NGGEHRHCPQKSVAERGERRKSETDERQRPQHRTQGEKDGSDQCMGHGGTVRLRPVAANEFSDVRGGLGHLVPRSTRCRRREHNAYSTSAGIRGRGGYSGRCWTILPALTACGRTGATDHPRSSWECIDSVSSPNSRGTATAGR